VLDAIAGWINKYRNMHGAQDELVHCSQEDVMQIAKDLGVSVSDLRGLAAKNPGAADTLQKMLLGRASATEAFRQTRQHCNLLLAAVSATSPSGR
jgi:hypothetical protein